MGNDRTFLSNKAEYTIAAFLGIAPFCSPKRGGILQPRLNKAYGATLVVLVVSGRAYVAAEVFKAHKGSLNATKTLLKVLDEFTLDAVYVTQILSSCVFGQQRWTEMRRNFDAFRNIGGFFGAQKGFFRSKLAFVALHMVILLPFLFGTANSSASELLFGVLEALNFYLYVYICLVIHFLAADLAREYRELNRLLLETFGGNADGATKREDRAENCKLFTYLRLLDETVEAFNAVFGYPLLLIVARFLSFSLSSLEQVIFREPALESGDQRYVWGFVVASLVAVYFLGCPFLVLVSCDGIKGAQTSTGSLCNELQERARRSPTARTKLLCMANFVRENPVAFRAAGFFDVDRTILFGALNILTTYLIVILQFNGGSQSA